MPSPVPNWPHRWQFLPDDPEERAEFLAEVRGWLESGMSQTAAAARIGCCRRTLSTWFEAMGYVPPEPIRYIPPKHSPERRRWLEAIAVRYDVDHKTIREIAADIGCQYAAARRYIMEAGCVLRPRGNDPGKPKPPPVDRLAAIRNRRG